MRRNIVSVLTVLVNTQKSTVKSPGKLKFVPGDRDKPATVENDPELAPNLICVVLVVPPVLDIV